MQNLISSIRFGKSVRTAGLLAVLMTLSLAYQNCSKVGFAAVDPSGMNAKAGAGDSTVFPVPADSGIPDVLGNENPDAGTNPTPAPTPAPDLEPGDNPQDPGTNPTPFPGIPGIPGIPGTGDGANPGTNPTPIPTPAPDTDPGTGGSNPPPVIDGKNCFDGQVPQILFDSIAVDPAAPDLRIVNFQGPTLNVESAGSLFLANIHASLNVKKAEHVTLGANIHASDNGGHAIVARSIDTLANLHGDMTVANAVTIGQVANVHATLLRMTARNIDSVANMHGTSICVSAQNVGLLANLHAPVIALQGRREAGVLGRLPTVANLHAEFMELSGFAMDGAYNLHADTLVIRNAKIERLANVQADLVLENSEIGMLINHHGKIYHKNSIIKSQLNSHSEMQPEGVLP